MPLHLPGGAEGHLLENETVVSDQLDPLLYPWDPPETSGLVHGDEFLPLQLTSGLDNALVGALDEALLEADAAPLASRSLVVSLGCNSSPDVLRRKFASYQHPVSPVLPLVRGQLHDVAVGHSAHVSRAGYIAAAPYLRLGECTSVWVSWLDEGQLMALDESEPNYRRIELHGDVCPLILEGGERPEAFSLYTSRWGVLTDGGADKLPFLDQPALYRILAGGGPGDGDGGASMFGGASVLEGASVFAGPSELVAGRLGVPSFQAWATEWFSSSGLAAPAHLDGLSWE